MPNILIVDDSSLMRRVLTSVVEGIDRFKVAGVAVSAEEAQRQLEELRPDAVVLDVNLPGMNGVAFLARLRERYRIPAVIISSRTFKDIARSHGNEVSGSFDFVEKPDGINRNLEDFRRELGQCLVTLVQDAGREVGRPAKPPPRPVLVRSDRYRLIALGASTGGVDAVHTVLSGIAGRFPPMVVVLHMPAAYTARFAQRLATVTGHLVAEAQDGEALLPGQVRIGPGGLHLRIESRAGVPVTRLHHGPAVNGHKPSVDILFESIAATFEQAAIGVILTGMGRDGANGLLAMRTAGAATFGQAGESCVVYGMPKAAKDLGAVLRELPLHEMGSGIMAALKA